MAGQTIPTDTMQSLRQNPTIAPTVRLGGVFSGVKTGATCRVVAVLWCLSICGLTDRTLLAAGGSLTFNLEDEQSHESIISRVEFFRGQSSAQPPASQVMRPKSMPIRQTVSAGLGVVVDRSVRLELPDGPYHFRIVRGPEYRIVGGNFVLEKTSLDEKTVSLPRMVDMQREGWLSGDCCVVPSSQSLPLRMASEDLHVAAVLGELPAKPIPHRDQDEKIKHEPTWIRADAAAHQGLVFYGVDQALREKIKSANSSNHAIAVVGKNVESKKLKIGVENPFAWELPIWLASHRVDGMFVFGDWLRLDKTIYRIREGRGDSSFSLRDPTQVGRYAERIYRHALDAGIRLVPLAGGGDQSDQTPVGYNRLYVCRASNNGGSETTVAQPESPASPESWWDHVWAGSSVATNGPLLRPLLGGRLCGHTFEARSGEVLRLQPELNLTVRDPVDYLEVIHNNQVHYSARLDDFAKAGGKIPPIETKESGWVMMRVLTRYEGHYRAAMTAPWWIEFDGETRVSPVSVQFFRDWLADYEERLTTVSPDEIDQQAPFVRAARRFWEQKASP